MNPYWVALFVLASVFGSALLGMRLRGFLPEHHLSDDTKDSVRIGMGLVATMAALILGLLVASAKNSYDTEKGEVIQMASKVTHLDRILLNYGMETAPLRESLRLGLEGAMLRIWAENPEGNGPADPSSAWSETLPKAIQSLHPTNSAQGAFKAQAESVTADLGQMRWLLFEQADSSISRPLLFVVIAWLAIIFGSVGLFCPSNATAIGSIFLSSVSVAGAIFLILELDQPFDGLIHISKEPMLNALHHLRN